MQRETLPNDGYRMTFASLEELLAEAQDCQNTRLSEMHGSACGRPTVAKCGVRSFGDAAELARAGWEDELPGALDVAEDAVSKVEVEHKLTTFVPTYDVAGSDVDVARFLSGEPECMVDYPLTPIVKAGRVITLCVSVSYGAAVKPETVIRRGRIVTGLALALSRLGYGIEIVADWSVSREYNGPVYLSLRTVVKSADDVIDPARILYALAHPSFKRVLTFSAAHSAPADVKRKAGIGGAYGYSASPLQDLADGAIYLPRIERDHDVAQAAQAITDYLRQLEIVTD